MQHEHTQHQTHNTHPEHIEHHLTVSEPAAVTPEPRVPTVGDHVLYVLHDDTWCHNAGHIRPAVVVRTWGNLISSTVQLQVFTDGTNDYPAEDTCSKGLMWVTSVPYSEDPKPRTWHWPTKKD